MAENNQTLRPPSPPGPLRWIQKNLFGSIFNSLLTLVSAYLLYLLVRGSLRWVLVTADWRPVLVSPLLYLVGQYPRPEIWRVGLSVSLISFLMGVSWGVWKGLLRSFAILLGAALALLALVPDPSETLTISHRILLVSNLLWIYGGYLLGQRLRGRHVLIGWLLLSLLIPILLRGFEDTFLNPVETTSWGGLMVTLILAVGGIALSFPIGLLLALGRRSSLPVLRIFCTVVIETVRGVPLVSILFMSSIILALFLPPETRIDRLVRALLGMTFFSAAYTAENVRGGLQAIPQGQIEAAKAIGLTGFQTMSLIVLPQALRLVIPAIVGQFISLFKDTTLAVIVAINELLNIGKAILQSDPEFIRLQAEVYVFIAFVFWVFSSLMSLASRRLESALGVGER